jgi:transforming growth factor-beta-induced protein
MRQSIVGLLVAFALLLSACAPAATPAPTQPPAPTEAPAPTTAPTQPPAPTPTEAPKLKDIVDTAVAAGSFTTLVKAVQAAGLVDTLKGAGPFTVFAPTDDAFAKLPAGTLDALLKDPAKLKDILLYHVVPGKVMAADAIKMDGKMADSALKGKSVKITVKDGKVMLNDSATVAKADIEASNGVIHVIDAVLLPVDDKMMAAGDKKDIVDTAIAAGSFTTLVKAVQAAGLVDTLKGAGPFTVFAPTDDAFAKLPAGTLDALLKDPAKLKDILLYHVVSGKVMAADAVKMDGKTAETALKGKSIKITVKDGKVMLNDSAAVAKADIEASNGVIHVIDAVLLPVDDKMMAAGDKKDIVDTAIAAGNFTTLVKAVQAAGLVDTLKGKGPFTVFAPTDAAFAKLPAGTLDGLLKDPAKLKDILLYHVVPADVMAADAVKLNGKTAETALKGKTIAITVKDGKVYLNGNVLVTMTDIVASNGVIHVIDAVLLPK